MAGADEKRAAEWRQEVRAGGRGTEIPRGAGAAQALTRAG